MFLTSQQRADFRSGRAAAIAKRYAHQYQPLADLMPTQTPMPRYLLIQVDCHRDDLGPRAEPVWTYLRPHHSARAAQDYCDRLRSEGRDDDFYLADLDNGTTAAIVDLPEPRADQEQLDYYAARYEAAYSGEGADVSSLLPTGHPWKNSSDSADPTAADQTGGEA